MREASEILHCDDVVSGDEKPTQALRRAKTTSMGLAIQAVKNGDAGAAVSAGNTGALMAMSKLALRTMPGIDRPALAALIPSLGEHDTVMLDLGANTECDARNLVQFAIMGAAYSRIITGKEAPRVRLLNIGTEEVKGHDTIRRAAAMLRASRLQIEFHGFVEGSDLTSGKVDVIVTDGFTGNVALKVAEGTVALYTRFLRDAFKSSFLARMGYALARPSLDRLRQRLDPRRYNGAMFLGLNGIVVKSHGGTDALGFANAIAVAADLVEKGTNERITAELNRLEDDDTLRTRHARAS
jgi:phosphate acyltransferase